MRKIDSPLEGHPTPRFAYNEAATGSLGQGLGIGVGMAQAARYQNRSYKTYVMLGDGESAEGAVWEAAELAAYYNLTNLVAILDCNRLGQSQATAHQHEMNSYEKKWQAFGWDTITIDGHDFNQIFAAFKQTTTATKPTILLAKTFKGAEFAQAITNQHGFHGKAFSSSEAQEIIRNLEQTHAQAVANTTTPLFFKSKTIPEKPSVKTTISIDLAKDPQTNLFTQGKKMASRKAYGYGLLALGKANQQITVLDADVKNSTHADFFEKEFPERFMQCFIAEQNAISVATGMQLRGLIPFAATFGCFWTRAHDQIRMAGIGRNALRICGSHAGVSIGEDGPSQMALEDIGMFDAIPNSIIFYPSDAVSSYKITELMANYHDGISYIKTTRAETPILYPVDEPFTIGGCKIVRQNNNDKLCIVAAGITLHEALKAEELLCKEGINVTVIDLYSIKPFDAATVLQATQKAKSTLLVVEDHYAQTGIAQIIAAKLINTNIKIHSLAVTKLSRSGSPEALMKEAGIDSMSIIIKVKELIS